MPPKKTDPTKAEPSPQVKPENPPVEIQAALTPDDIPQMIERMRAMNQEIQQKIELIYEKTGLPRKKIDAYLSDAKNFTPEVWHSLQKNIDTLEQKIWSVLGKELKKKTLDKKQEKFSKERKGKSLGARKNWIPMK